MNTAENSPAQSIPSQGKVKTFAFICEAETIEKFWLIFCTEEAILRTKYENSAWQDFQLQPKNN